MPTIVALPQKQEPKLFVNGTEVSDGKPVTISKIEIIENKSVAPAPELPPPIVAETKTEQTPIKTEETKTATDKDSFIVTPDYIQQSMFKNWNSHSFWIYPSHAPSSNRI